MIFTLGSQIGLLPTIALIFMTAMLGSWLLRQQGLATLARLQRGENMAESLSEGLILLVSGVLLVTPGFLTDALGLLGLIRPVRLILLKRLKKQFAQVQVQTWQSTQFTQSGTSESFQQTHYSQQSPSDSAAHRISSGVLEGEFVRQPEDSTSAK